MAVLAALAAFMKDLQIIGGYLSFIFTALTLLVWMELLTKFPKQSGTGRLFWFENLLTIGVLGLVIYLVGELLVAARGTHFGLVFALYAILMPPALWASLRLNERLWLKAFQPRGEGDRFAAYLVVVVPVAVVAYVAATLAAAPVAGVLNSVQPPAASPTPSVAPSPTSRPSVTPT